MGSTNPIDYRGALNSWCDALTDGRILSVVGVDKGEEFTFRVIVNDTKESEELYRGRFMLLNGKTATIIGVHLSGPEWSEHVWVH